MENLKNEKKPFISFIEKLIYGCLILVLILIVVAINVARTSQNAQLEEQSSLATNQLYHLDLATDEDITSNGNPSPTLTRDSVYGALQFDEKSDQFTLPALVKYDTYQIELVTGYEYGNLATSVSTSIGEANLILSINENEKPLGVYVPLIDHTYSFYINHPSSESAVITIAFNDFMTKEIAGQHYNFEYISLMQITIYGINQ